MGLTRISIARPVFVLVLILLCVFGGLTAFRSMRTELNPEVQFGVVTVTTVYPGAGPEEMATLVSRKIEDSISGVNGLQEVNSTSQEGVSVVIVSFELGTDMNVALNDVRTKVDSVVIELPEGAEKPAIDKIDSASEPILTLALSHPTLTPQQLRDLAENKLTDQFARIKGVAQVLVTGGDEREIQVQVKRDRLVSYGIGISQLQNALAATSLNVPAGRIESEGREYSLRVRGEYRTVEDIRNTVIRLNDPQDPSKGATFRLRDVADVVDTNVEKRQLSRVNGEPAVVLRVQKSREGNAVEVADAAYGTIDSIEKEYGINVTTVRDTSLQVRESLFDLNFTLFFGIVLVTFIVHLFLHDWRGTLIVFLAIPISLFATILVLRAIGYTLNNMTMLALSLAIGVLVDDAIVVLENIYRHLKMGDAPRDAALNGRGEIGLAAIAITFADLVVFVPMIFMGGIVGQFFKPMAAAFSIAVFVSLLVSFMVTPMLASRWYKEGDDPEHNLGPFARRFEGWFDRLAQRYKRGLEWSLKHRWFVFGMGFATLFGVFMFIGGGFAPSLPAAMMTPLNGPARMFIGVAVISTVWILIFYRSFRPRILLGGIGFALLLSLFGGAGYLYRQWKGTNLFAFEFAPSTDQGLVAVSVELLPGTRLEETSALAARLEKMALEMPDTSYVVTDVGRWSGSFGGAGGSSGTNLAELRINLHEKKSIMDSITFWKKHEEELRTRDDQSFAAQLIQKIGKVPGARITVAPVSGFGFGSAIQMSFVGSDRQKTIEVANEIARGLANGAVEGVINANVSTKPGKPEIVAEPDPARMAAANVSTAEIANVMRTLYEGNDDVKLRVGGIEYPIRVMMAPEDRNQLDLVNTVPVKFSQGSPIYLPQVANLVNGVTIDKIDRRDRQDEARVTADLLPGYAALSVQANIDQWIKDKGLMKEGVIQKPLGQAQAAGRETGFLLNTIVIGLVLVYLLLAALYDNLLYPFIIQLAQPQAFTGAILALVLTDKPLNIISMIGLIALVGLVGKNAILLVDYTNTLRARGINRHDALTEAGPTRLRPILMTTSAILLGMLPVALAIGRGSEFRETLGIVIIGGISLSTLLTLFVIPSSYTIFDDLNDAIGRLRGGRAKPTSNADTPADPSELTPF